MQAHHLGWIWIGTVVGWGISSAVVEGILDIKYTWLQGLLHDLPAYVAGIIMGYYFFH